VADYGGAIFFDLFNSEILLVSNILESNVAWEEGGAIYTLASDLSMLNCQVLNNKAGSGGGVYYPQSDDSTDHVNITSCVFEGNSAVDLYGGVYVEFASSVTIASSNFSCNAASFGSALGVVGSSGVDMSSCSFLNNIASGSAGAVFVENSNLIAIETCHFKGNVAQSGFGAAIWITLSSEVSIQNNQFIANRAIAGGGAVYWLVSSGMDVPSGLENTLSSATSGNYYEDNVAMYGSNVSTDVAALSLGNANIYEVDNYNTYVPPVVVYAVDYYDQVVKVESTGVVVASVLSTVECYQSTGYVTGGFIEQSVAGVFNFSALDAYCDPGYQMGVNITSPYYEGISAYFVLMFRLCVRGEYYQDSVCKPCEVGTYSLTDPSTKELSDLSNSDVCKPCPSGARDCYGDTIVLKEGNWRISDYSTALLACPYGDHACRGGTGSGDSLCGKGYTGKLSYYVIYIILILLIIMVMVLFIAQGRFALCVMKDIPIALSRKSARHAVP
jgi:hypothetical protein